LPQVLGFGWLRARPTRSERLIVGKVRQREDDPGRKPRGGGHRGIANQEVDAIPGLEPAAERLPPRVDIDAEPPGLRAWASSAASPINAAS